MEYKRVAVKSAKLVETKNGKKVIQIKFPFDYETVKQVKELSGRKFHNDSPTNKYWTASLLLDNVELLNKYRFQLCEELKQYIQQTKIDISVVEKIEVAGLPHKLYHFQEIGVGFLEAKNGRALIADEMGLGKTVQALAWLQLHLDKRPVIIIVPASLKLNWKKETRKWVPKARIEILTGKSPHGLTGDIIIINYDIVEAWLDVLKAYKPQVIIMDEIHYTKNKKTKRSKAVRTLCKGVPHVIGLSGTPIVNRPIEIYNAVSMIDRTLFPDAWSFAHRYCGARHTGFGWDFNGATNIGELHEKLTSSIMIRRLKKDVLQDLPDKMYNYIPFELDNEKDYKAAETDFVSYVKGRTEIDLRLHLREVLGEELSNMVEFTDHKLDKLKQEKAEKAEAGGVLAQIEMLKQLAVKGKMNNVISWISDFLESGEKLVVMATHRFVIDRLMQEFGVLAVKVDGSVKNEDRQKAVEQFQNKDNVKLFIGNIKAAGVGLTLTAASNVAFIELPWTPGDVQQAEDRCHRIGQTKGVQVHFLLASETIEEQIAKLIDKKRQVLDAVLDGKETKSESLLYELIQLYTK